MQEDAASAVAAEGGASSGPAASAPAPPASQPQLPRVLPVQTTEVLSRMSVQELLALVAAAERHTDGLLLELEARGEAAMATAAAAAAHLASLSAALFASSSSSSASGSADEEEEGGDTVAQLVAEVDTFWAPRAAADTAAASGTLDDPTAHSAAASGASTARSGSRAETRPTSPGSEADALTSLLLELCQGGGCGDAPAAEVDVGEEAQLVQRLQQLQPSTLLEGMNSQGREYNELVSLDPAALTQQLQKAVRLLHTQPATEMAVDDGGLASAVMSAALALPRVLTEAMTGNDAGAPVSATGLVHAATVASIVLRGEKGAQG